MKKPINTHPDELIFHCYLDNELSYTGRQDFEAHLSQCAKCTSQLNQLRSLFGSIESLPEITLGNDLTSAILVKINSKPKIAKGFWLALLGETVGVILLIWATWPILETGFIGIGLSGSAFTFPSINFDLSSNLSELLLNVSIWVNEVQSLFEINFIPLEQSSIYLIPLVLSAGLLMILGNQILLRDIRSRNFR